MSMKMSAELCLSPGPGGNNGSIIVLVLGTSVFTVTAVLVEERDTRFIWTAIPPGFVQGTLVSIGTT